MSEHFDVFGKSRVKKQGRFIKEHFEQYGWINFLKTIAATKVFDMPGCGMNSIDCAREASAFDVLVYASEEKSFSESQYLDQEAEYEKMKLKSKI